MKRDGFHEKFCVGCNEGRLVAINSDVLKVL